MQTERGAGKELEPVAQCVRRQSLFQIWQTGRCPLCLPGPTATQAPRSLRTPSACGRTEDRALQIHTMQWVWLPEPGMQTPDE